MYIWVVNRARIISGMVFGIDIFSLFDNVHIAEDEGLLVVL